MPNQPRPDDIKTSVTLTPEQAQFFDDLLARLQLAKRADWGLTRNRFIVQLAMERGRLLAEEFGQPSQTPPPREP